MRETREKERIKMCERRRRGAKCLRGEGEAGSEKRRRVPSFALEIEL